MVWGKAIGVPNVNFFTSGEIELLKVIEAYEYLEKTYKGIHSFIEILSYIYKKGYAMPEVFMAGMLLIDAVDGWLIPNNFIFSKYKIREKYLRINGVDFVLVKDKAFSDEKMIFWGEYLSDTTFIADNGLLIQIKDFPSKGVMKQDEDKTGKADPLREKGQEEAHRQEHEPGGACSPAGMQQAVPVQDPDR